MSVAPPPNVAILIIGNEITTGAVADTNGALLARELTRLGATVKTLRTVGDDHQAIVSALGELIRDSEIVFTTGGLGPTSDDITRDAIAAHFRLPLERSAEAFSRMEGRYRERKIPINTISERQCFFPKGAECFPNPVGTADSFSIISGEGTRAPMVWALPGVPRELEAILTQQIEPYLLQRFPSLFAPEELQLKFFGLSESFIGDRIEACDLPEEISVAYRPVTPEVWVKLTVHRSRGSSDSGTTQILAAARQRIAERIGNDFIFTSDPAANLPDIVGGLLAERKKRVAIAESCSGGQVAHELVKRPGSSAYLLASLVTYSNDSKEVFLGVSHDLLIQHGAVSEAVALEMAYGARVRSGADIGVSLTGIAGPTGGSPEKPVGTVWIGYDNGVTSQAFHHVVPYSRNLFRTYSTWLAIDRIRRDLLGYPLKWERQ